MQKLTQTVGFIGSGNMARAILKGMIAGGLLDGRQAFVSDISADQVQSLVEDSGANATSGNIEVAQKTDVIIFATKPYQVAEVCEEIRHSIRADQLFISICAGIRTSKIESALGADVRVVRVMPNTPALIGCGSAGIAAGRNARREDLALVSRIFNSVGVSVIVEEDKLDLVTGLIGSGPAYVFRFMEALIEAGQELGLSTEEALALVPQMVYGTARMAVESSRPLHELRGAVTTKGGTTEAGLQVLEEGDFFQLIRDGVDAATRRSRELAG